MIQAINAMSPSEQKEAAWVYWKARGLQARGARLAGGRGAARDQPRAAREHRRPAQLLRRARRRRARPDADAAAAAGAADAPPSAKRPPPIPASARGLTLISIGLRNEGVREWNYSIRGLGERELLAAAQLACEREVWDRCINTSEKTRAEIDIEQRYPTPLRKEVSARAARDRPRPGVRLRPDPPGVALHRRCPLGRRRVRPDAADAGDGEVDREEDRPALQRRRSSPTATPTSGSATPT